MSELQADFRGDGLGVALQKDKTKVEVLKESSKNLRGTLIDDVVNETTRFGNNSELLLKFYGVYQQKDRDRRKPGEPPGDPKPFTLMVRGRIPGGRLDSGQYLSWDQVADRYSSNGLRLTTRQSIQIHGVLKRNLKAAIKEVHESLGSTIGACGDVVRNVTQAVNPWGDPRIAQIEPLVDQLSKHFEVESNAYFEIFLDGEQVAAERDDPIYGRAYLPRKFKLGVTVAGNNSIDIYTHDLGLVATFDEQDSLDGYHVLVGGGMGMSHGDAATHPRLADDLGWIPAKAVLVVSEAIVTTQRDHGNRDDRTFARLKYLIDKNGIDWFRREVERRSETSFEARAVPVWKTPRYLGWNQHRDGSLTLGFHTLSGRIVDTENKPLKSVLRNIVRDYALNVQVTAEQDLILYGIQPKDRVAIEEYLSKNGLSGESPRQVYDRALTCVALPTCIKALAEAERVGPEIFAALQASLDRFQLSERAPVIRVTGCPNGCARPFAAEIGLVGQAPGQYAVYLGGDAEGQRLAIKVRDKVKIGDLPELFSTLSSLWSEKGFASERLGDFVHRYGHEQVGALL